MSLDPTTATVHVLRHGKKSNDLLGWKIAHASSERPGVQRWSELTLYLSSSGEYFAQKIGRSVVAHKPTCSAVDHRMMTWAEAPETERTPRSGCLECQPEVDPIGTDVVLEPQRYTVLRGKNLDQLLADLVKGGAPLPRIVERVADQAYTFEALFGGAY